MRYIQWKKRSSLLIYPLRTVNGITTDGCILGLGVPAATVGEAATMLSREGVSRNQRIPSRDR